MESGIIGLELVHEHRNYLPSLGIIGGVAFGLWSAAQRYNFKIPASAAIAGPLIALWYGTHSRASIWAGEEALVRSMAENHPASARSRHMLGELQATRAGDPLRALRQYALAATLAPWETGYLTTMVGTGARVSLLGPGRGQPPQPSGPVPESSADETTPMRPSMVTVQLGSRRTLVPNEAMIRQISLGLGKGPITPLTILALDNVIACLVAADRLCRELHRQLSEWLETAIRNPRVSGTIGAQIAVQLGNLYLDSGEYHSVIRVARQGSNFDEDELIFRLMEANAYMLLGEFDRAERNILSTKTSFGGLSEGVLTHAGALLSAIDSRRRGEVLQ